MNKLLKYPKHPFNRITFTFLVILTFYFSGFTQPDIVKIHNKYYTSYFSSSEHIPIIVKYTLTNDMLQCPDKVKRTNKFKPDPRYSDITNLSKDYKHSGYDKGHNMSSGDNKCDVTGMKECFYYSNMTPQPHSFNAGEWENLEKYERADAIQYGKVIITIGSIGKHETIGIDKVVVPEYMWKVIYIPYSNTYECYYFPNSDNLTKPFNEYKVSLQQIEKTGRVTFNQGNAEMIK